MSKSFECARYDSVHVQSTWHVKRDKKSRSQQCDPLDMTDETEQTIVSAYEKQGTADVELQCDVADSGLATAQPHHEGSNVYVYPGNGTTLDNDVVRFLREISPAAIGILEANVKSRAFIGYEVSRDEGQDAVQLHHSLAPAFVLQSEWHVAQMEWNCNKTSVAVAYGRLDVSTWCLDRGNLCVFSSASVATAGSKPDVTLEQDAYVTALGFHPTEPATLAVGTHTGDVVLLSVGRDDTTRVLFSTKNSTSVPHRDPISRILWLHNVDARGVAGYWLCTIGADGKVILWKRPSGQQQEMPETPWLGFQANLRGNAVGILTADATMRVAGSAYTLLLGTECGEVLTTRLSAIPTTIPQMQMAKDSVLPSLPVDSTSAHFSTVQGVAYSPFGGTIFATCGCDGVMKVFSSIDRVQLLAAEPGSGTEAYLTDIAFSPWRPAVIACVSRNAYLYIFDLTVSKSKPVLSVVAGSEGCAVTSVRFHPRDQTTLLTGDSRGSVNVWTLPYHIYDPSPAERRLTSSSKSKDIREAWGEILGVSA
eukprot:PhM_4_TR2853/c0_g1_i2/m.92894